MTVQPAAPHFGKVFRIPPNVPKTAAYDKVYKRYPEARNNSQDFRSPHASDSSLFIAIGKDAKKLNIVDTLQDELDFGTDTKKTQNAITNILQKLTSKSRNLSFKNNYSPFH